VIVTVVLMKSVPQYAEMIRELDRDTEKVQEAVGAKVVVEWCVAL